MAFASVPVPRAAGRDLIGNPFRFRRCHQQLENARIDIRAARDDRAAADLEIARAFLLDPGRVGAVRDVERDTDFGFTRERARVRAAQSDFLLHRRDADDACFELRPCSRRSTSVTIQVPILLSKAIETARSLASSMYGCRNTPASP